LTKDTPTQVAGNDDITAAWFGHKLNTELEGHRLKLTEAELVLEPEYEGQVTTENVGDAVGTKVGTRLLVIVMVPPQFSFPLQPSAKLNTWQ